MTELCLHVFSEMKITFLGAARTVTGSRILIEHNHTKILVDCGLFQGPKELRQWNWNELPDLKGLKAVILTHVHIDHSGYLPKLYRDGFRGPVYGSQASMDLLPIMLMDAAKLQEEDARYANRSKYSHHDPAMPLYEAKDAHGCQSLFHSVPWHEWRQTGPDLSFRLLRSGHILGSACVQIAFTENSQSRILTLTGDLGPAQSETLKEAEFVHETDFLIIESTYGNRQISREEVPDRLASVIQKVWARQGTLIIPSFSVGRTQDLLFLIKKLKKEKKIPQVPVYLDSPMSHAVTAVYLRHLEELKIGVGSEILQESLESVAFQPVLTPDESMLLAMSDEPKIVISASGMLQGGRILHHLKTKLGREQNGVLFVGFQSAGTKGRLLKEGISSLRIHHQEVPVEAEIFSLDGLSAHADSDELLHWLGKFIKAPQKVFVNHGEPEASFALKERIEKQFSWPSVEVAEMNRSYDLSCTDHEIEKTSKGIVC